jgi:hypothetical protein
LSAFLGEQDAVVAEMRLRFEREVCDVEVPIAEGVELVGGPSEGGVDELSAVVGEERWGERVSGEVCEVGPALSVDTDDPEIVPDGVSGFCRRRDPAAVADERLGHFDLHDDVASGWMVMGETLMSIDRRSVGRGRGGDGAEILAVDIHAVDLEVAVLVASIQKDAFGVGREISYGAVVRERLNGPA